MSATVVYLALDLGAESGRSVLGSFDGERVSLREVHRFQNAPVRLPDGLHWDALRIFDEVKKGMVAAAQESQDLASVGVDTWGVDFGLLDRSGALVANPYHYRDGRTDGMVELAAQRMPRAEIYRTTGIQFMPINTLYQLLAYEGSPLLEAADTLLMMPDLVNYWLTGVKACEYTISSTSQLYGLSERDWARDLIGRMGIPERIFPTIVSPGASLGDLSAWVRKETGLSGLPVTAVASHDTASAVAAVPAEGDFAYISSGTWSLVGVETDEPVTDDGALRSNFTNEGGFGGKVRLLRNVMGLWLLQECKRTWARDGHDYSYDELTRLAEEATPFGALVDPDHPAFLAPGDMPARMGEFCAEIGQKAPEGPGEFARCVYESLALKYRWVLERAEELGGRRAEVIHVVGGGSRSALLCQLTADAARRPVKAGPVEATALGNTLVQAYARGDVGSLEEMREIVRSSVEVTTYEPAGDPDAWEEAFDGFEGLLGTGEGAVAP